MGSFFSVMPFLSALTPLTSATFLEPILTTTSLRGSNLGFFSAIFSELWAMIGVVFWVASARVVGLQMRVGRGILAPRTEGGEGQWGF